MLGFKRQRRQNSIKSATAQAQIPITRILKWKIVYFKKLTERKTERKWTVMVNLAKMNTCLVHNCINRRQNFFSDALQSLDILTSESDLIFVIIEDVVSSSEPGLFDNFRNSRRVKTIKRRVSARLEICINLLPFTKRHYSETANERNISGYYIHDSTCKRDISYRSMCWQGCIEQEYDGCYFAIVVITVNRCCTY
jgi:hypothetical protein